MPFDPLLWDNKNFQWVNKLFIKKKVYTFIYIPIGFGRAMRQLNKLVKAAGEKNIDNLCLSHHLSPWIMNVYLAVDREIQNANKASFSGNYLSRVYEGAFNEAGIWCNDFETDAKAKGIKINKMYMWYTTCPKCAKKQGKNYVVIISEIE